MRWLAPLLAASTIVVCACSSPGHATSVPSTGARFTRPATIDATSPPPPPNFTPRPPSSATRKPLGTHAAFFAGEAALTNGVYYLQLPNGNVFGYYAYLPDQNYIYHFDLGYEYVVDAKDGKGGVYLYDFYAQRWWYTSPQFAFPYLWDFSENGVSYYYADSHSAGHYTSYPRYFFSFALNQIEIVPAEVPDWSFNDATATTSMGAGGGTASIGPSQGVSWTANWGHNTASSAFSLTSSLAVSANDTTPANFFALPSGLHPVAYLKLSAVPAITFDQLPAQTITVNAPSTFGGTTCFLNRLKAQPTGLSWEVIQGPDAVVGTSLSIPATVLPPGGNVVAGSAGAGGPTILGLACTTLTTPTVLDAVQITATWSGGAKGPPTDSKATAPVTWKGSLCPASSVTFNYGDPKNKNSGTGLFLSNGCADNLDYHVCAFAGNLPTSSLHQCAPNALQTPQSTFVDFTYLGGTPLQYSGVDLGGDPAIILYYCSSGSTFVGPPDFSRVGCI